MATAPPAKSQPHNKKRPARPAFSAFRCGSRSSVFCDDRAAPAIVDADGDEIDVLADAIVAEHRAVHTEHAVVEEGDGTILHEQMIVFDPGRPVRGEGVF